MCFDLWSISNDLFAWTQANEVAAQVGTIRQALPWGCFKSLSLQPEIPILYMVCAHQPKFFGPCSFAVSSQCLSSTRPTQTNTTPQPPEKLTSILKRKWVSPSSHRGYHFESLVSCSTKLFHYPVTPPRLEAVSSSFFSQQTNWHPPKNRPRSQKILHVPSSWNRCRLNHRTVLETFKLPELSSSTNISGDEQDCRFDTYIIDFRKQAATDGTSGSKLDDDDDDDDGDGQYRMHVWISIPPIFLWKWWPPIPEETK